MRMNKEWNKIISTFVIIENNKYNLRVKKKQRE